MILELENEEELIELAKFFGMHTGRDAVMHGIRVLAILRRIAVQKHDLMLVPSNAVKDVTDLGCLPINFFR